jgi:hypothetical protein
MSLEGPAFVPRWRDASQDDSSGVVSPERIETIAELPYRLHVDHPERLELWPEAGLGALLVIYDAPATERIDPDILTVWADVICRIEQNRTEAEHSIRLPIGYLGENGSKGICR